MAEQRNESSAASEPHESGEGCLDCPHPDYCAGMGKCEIGAAKIAARDRCRCNPTESNGGSSTWCERCERPKGFADGPPFASSAAWTCE